MENESPDPQTSQNVKAGRNATVVGRDYKTSTTINLTLWISIILIGLLAVGAASVLGVRVKLNGEKIEIELQNKHSPSTN